MRIGIIHILLISKIVFIFFEKDFLSWFWIIIIAIISIILYSIGDGLTNKIVKHRVKDLEKEIKKLKQKNKEDEKLR